LGPLTLDPERGIVELLGAARTPVGLGFLVDRGTVVTCAHVVNAALGRLAREVAEPDGQELWVRFRFAPGAPQRRALIVHGAPSTSDEFDRADMAGLRLEDEPPAGADAVTLGGASDFAGEPRIDMWGPVSDRTEGGHVSGTLLGLLPGGRRQLNQEVVGTFRARPGFSGGPVWLLHGTRRIVGMLVAIAGRDEARDVYVLDVERLATLWPEQLRVGGDIPSLEVIWGPAGFGLRPGEFVYVLPGNAVVECALGVVNRGSALETLTRVEVNALVVQRVRRRGGGVVSFPLEECRLVGGEGENGLAWSQVADGRWTIDGQIPLAAGKEMWLPSIGLALGESDESPLGIRQYVAVPSLALNFEVTVSTERQRFSAGLSGPLRIFSPLDEGGDENIDALLSQLDALGDEERASLRAAYQSVLRYDLQVREQIAQGLTEGELGRRLALADAAIAREPDVPKAHAARAGALISLERYEDALESYDTAIRLGLESAGVHADRGIALLTLERANDALAAFDRSLELAPDIADTQFWRAFALAACQRDQEALAAVENALSLGFTDGGLLTMLGEQLERDAALEFRRLLDSAGLS
jgi:hypothetical protein